MNEIASLYEHFGPDEQESIDFLMDCCYDYAKISELQEITGVTGYSRDCLRDLARDLLRLQDWLSELIVGEKEALIRDHWIRELLGRATMIDVSSAIGEDVYLMITIVTSKSINWQGIVIECDSEGGYHATLVQPHWA
jgi:hypothetical protein